MCRPFFKSVSCLADYKKFIFKQEPDFRVDMNVLYLTDVFDIHSTLIQAEAKQLASMRSM